MFDCPKCGLPEERYRLPSLDLMRGWELVEFCRCVGKHWRIVKLGSLSP